MENVTLYKEYHIDDYVKLQTINRREVLRYAGAGVGSTTNEEMLTIMEACITEALPVLTYRVSYRTEAISWKDAFDSKDLNINLDGCSEVILFAATIGIGIDRLISKYSRVAPTKALFMQAFGAERIEALCDTFEDEVRSLGKLHPRFSPGYGDLPLMVQKDMFRVLDCERRLGLTLNESLLMSPSKSVTAIIGIEKGILEESDNCSNTDSKNDDKCLRCSKYDCEYRKLRH